MPNGKLVKGEIGRDNCFGSYNGTERKIALALACFLRSQSPGQPACELPLFFSASNFQRLIFLSSSPCGLHVAHTLLECNFTG